MAKIGFEVYIDGNKVATAGSREEYLIALDEIDKYFAEHPELNRDHAKVTVKVTQSPCKKC